MFGLFPRKGIIAPGSDADLVLIDPQKVVTLSHADLHMDADWSPYEGMPLRGYPVCTIARGRVVIEDGQFVGVVAAGRFVPRRLE